MAPKQPSARLHSLASAFSARVASGLAADSIWNHLYSAVEERILGMAEKKLYLNAMVNGPNEVSDHTAGKDRQEVSGQSTERRKKSWTVYLHLCYRPIDSVDGDVWGRQDHQKQGPPRESLSQNSSRRGWGSHIQRPLGI